MDEPFSGLDPIVRQSIVDGLLSFVDLKVQTVIITTHDILEVEAILDTVAAIKDGQILDMIEVEHLRNQQGLSIIEWMKQIYK